ncbi:MAG: hypothetical protein IJ001_12665 [Oscillospiraceae bacterium]|nr:hypothetical protein [Oscillospiraceae bacterium]MBQ8835757.1 hypothetical protein [Oscillospiraceae bacterium]
MKKWIFFVLCFSIFLSGCGNSAGKDYVFAYEGTEIPMHAPAEGILTALGEPVNYTETPSCAFEGLDKTYYFGGFYLTTYPGDKGDCVSGLWFADDSVTTPEGIRIGSTQAEVEAAYGTGGFNGTNAYFLTGEGMKLSIILINGTVGSVQYEAVFS